MLTLIFFTIFSDIFKKILRFFQNLDREHIAQVMSITPQTVSNILQIAFKGIRKNWKDEYYTLFVLYLLFF